MKLSEALSRGGCSLDPNVELRYVHAQRKRALRRRGEFVWFSHHNEAHTPVYAWGKGIT